MDKDTRNRIQRATEAARALLEHEYGEQLQGVFDIRLDGTIEAEPGEHLDAPQRVLRTKLVTAVLHQGASGMNKADAVAAYLREAAFTTLNRFVALKMLEARELVQECISRGDQSAGFKEFTGLAAGLVQLPDHGYRIYIESLFDEIGREVRELFDRRDSASLLWPRRQALLDLLGVLNATELNEVWAEDETIGWVYQYFNSDDERKQMRAESHAPRNSRELAVRNQFFTPRYVVQFLTDNTLGRIWYEMRQGETRLRDLEYLVCRPNEIFLADGEEPPEDADTGDENLSQEELLRRPVHVHFREKKDPRDIRVLDPACGSGHFLLYAFDLLLTIYEEAWTDGTSPASKATGRTLRGDYEEMKLLRAAVPWLILRNNIYGIDIDARCAQIAALALWMRAQRSFRDLNVPREIHSLAKKTNIVLAEPMPSLDTAAATRFVESLDSALRHLVEKVFEYLKVAGDAGSLLRVEDAIREAVRNLLGEHGALFRSSDEERWRDAEHRVLEALQAYAETSGTAAYQRRLFAHDAASGFGFIDLCSQRYDVILMNPPFGDPSQRGGQILQGPYADCRHDIDAAFVRRAEELVVEGGAVGAIINRTQFFKDVLGDWRRSCLLGNWKLDCCADLGLGVLDGAMVEAACYVVFNRPTGSIAVLRALDVVEKKNAVLSGMDSLRSGVPDKRVFIAPHSGMAAMPSSRIAYWASPSIRRAMSRYASVDPNIAFARQGLITADNTRFLRLRWEVPHGEVETDKQRVLARRNAWVPYAKGGDYSPYFGDVHLVVQWGLDGTEIKATVDKKGRQASRPQNQGFYFTGGITYTERTASGFSPRVLQPGCMFDCKGPIVGPRDFEDTGWLLGVLMSRPIAAMLELAVAAGDTSVAFGAARQYTQSIVGSVPIPDLSSSGKSLLKNKVDAIWLGLATLNAQQDTSAFYGKLPTGRRGSLSEEQRARWKLTLEVLEATWEIERVVREAYALDVDADTAIADEFGGHPCSLPMRDLSNDGAIRLKSLWALSVDKVVERAREETGGARFVMKSQFFVDKKLELVSHLLNCHPRRVLEECEKNGFLDEGVERAIARDWLFAFIGQCFRRWARDDDHRRVEVGPWEGFPRCSLEEHALELLVDDQGHERDFLGQVEDSRATDILRPAGSNATTLRQWVREELFSWTIERYSKSRRRAPIYWQISTGSGAYSVWLYYHRVTGDTLYRVLNDYVASKLRHEERRLTDLVQELGSDPAGSQRRNLDAQESFVDELRAFRNEVARVAPLWNPNLNDGVIVNFAPLWRLVPQHKPWQKECKATWDKLCKGDFDWTHLAMHLWPERVVPKCAEDRSLAIAHDLENVFWYQDSDGKWQPRTVDQGAIDRLVKERTSAAARDGLKSLLEASAPATGGTSKKKAPRAKGTRKTAVSARPKAATNAASSPGRVSSATDPELLRKVKQAIAANGDGASKTDVINATGITPGQLNTAIKTLLADGSMTQTGERRGARYYLAGDDV